jgi:hypothetical protein
MGTPQFATRVAGRYPVSKGDLEGVQPSARSCFMYDVADCCCCDNDSHRVCCGTRDIEVLSVPESAEVPVPIPTDSN